jgi:RimJ/RimL family protein N-acetyltransferase
MKEGSGPYRVMPRNSVTDGVIVLRAVEPKDVESIRQWRNAQMDVLRQSVLLTRVAQRAYFASVVWPMKSHLEPGQILLAIEQEGNLIGYGGLVHISWPDLRAEVSFLLEPSMEKEPDALVEMFSRFLDLVSAVAFQDLRLHRLSTETFDVRSAHIATLENSGFVQEGLLRKKVIVENVFCDSLLHGLLASEWETKC